MEVVGKHGFSTTASLRSPTVTAKSAEPVLRLCPDLGTTSGQTRDTNPCLRELDFGVEELKISKKALDNILEYLFTTQIREGFSLDSKLSVVGWIETVQGENKNLCWISQNALVRSAHKPEVLNTLLKCNCTGMFFGGVNH